MHLEKRKVLFANFGTWGSVSDETQDRVFAAIIRGFQEKPEVIVTVVGSREELLDAIASFTFDTVVFRTRELFGYAEYLKKNERVRSTRFVILTGLIPDNCVLIAQKTWPLETIESIVLDP